MAGRKYATTIPFRPTGLADILQGFRLFARSMDAMSPSLAEAARRLLRTEGTHLIVPKSLENEANELSLEISDGIPKLIREPHVSVGRDGEVIVTNLCRIGGEEPEVEICWIPATSENLDQIWGYWIAQIRDLMVAGYPGCTGCGGPGSEGDWDELASRARMRVNAGVT